MKWKGKKDTFVDGEIRTTQRFALFPVKLSDYTWVWLEHYRLEEEFLVPFQHGIPLSEITLPRFVERRKYQ